jgi:tetratricopeptide (TPR) repeat protein
LGVFTLGGLLFSNNAARIHLMKTILEALRHHRGWTRQAVADRYAVLSRRIVGHTKTIDESTVARWESGDSCAPQERRILEAVFETKLDHLGLEILPVSLKDERNLNAADLLELRQRIERSDISLASMELLGRYIDGLCRRYPTGSGPALYQEGERWLKKTVPLLKSSLSPRQRRELAVHLGWLSAITSCLAHDSGDSHRGEALRNQTNQLGRTADHAEIQGWAQEIGAWISLTQGNPTAALKFAEAGQSIDGTSCVSVQLAAQEARAWAQLGDLRASQAAMSKGNRLLAKLPTPLHTDHHFVVDPAKADFYAVDCFRTLGVFDAAKEYAQRVIEHSEQEDGSIEAPMRRSEALLTLGVVSAQEGDLDAAVAYGIEGLTDNRKCLPSLRVTAKDLDIALENHHRAHPVQQWRAALGAAFGSP